MYPPPMCFTSSVHLIWLDLINQIIRNTKIPGARLPRRLNIALWGLIFVVPSMELHVTLLAPWILRLLLDFWKFCETPSIIFRR